MLDADCHIGQGEHRVHDEVGHTHDQQKLQPRSIDEIQVRMRVVPRGACPAHVEAAVRIDGTLQNAIVSLGKTRVKIRLFHLR
jgi:hypothetical protein